ncbi:Signal recognition particle receptor subunit beta [Vitis vinifera]|uniref:Signal recognition particle receptor subunit beta n=1 Tax=Vitis vinifera TaxID=29760 RepID=A0A438KB98_VITVI|nr:Signal recognition particle receptor subunit beta [Vitis vinifera]
MDRIVQWKNQLLQYVNQAQQWLQRMSSTPLYTTIGVVSLSTIVIFSSSFPSPLVLYLLDSHDKFRWLKPRKSNTIILAGLSGSGKTVLFYQLCQSFMCQLRDGSSHQGTVTSTDTNEATFVLQTDPFWSSSRKDSICKISKHDSVAIDISMPCALRGSLLEVKISFLDHYKIWFFFMYVHNYLVSAHLYAISSLFEQKGKRRLIHLVDVPGQSHLRSKLDKYLPQAAGLIFLVDGLEFLRHCPAIAEYLLDILTNTTVVKRKIPVLIVCNKTDKVTAHTKEFIQKLLEREMYDFTPFSSLDIKYFNNYHSDSHHIRAYKLQNTCNI